MKVEIISVGTEILMGNIVNTNAAYLAEQCAKLRLVCYYQSVVGDNEERLTAEIKTAVGRSDVVILSGGLGPTEDDLTKETAAKVMGRNLVSDARQRQDISDYFAKLGRDIPESNWKQAMVPEGSKVLYNPNGTAPGIIISDANVHLILLPGPPSEMKPMFEDQVIPYLKEVVPDCLYSKTIKICGIGESKVASILSDIISKQTNPTIATYAKPGEVHLRVTAKAADEDEAKKLVKPVVKEIKNRLGAAIYTTREDVTLEQDVVELLTANNLTISTVESCTGGMVSSRIINVPGASDVFKYGFVTYSNKAKRKLVGVKKATLEKYTAVSEQVANEMAKGAAAESKADVAISVTGLAGPGGGTDEIPVGTVFIGCCIKGESKAYKYIFSGNRQRIREQATSAALTVLRKSVLEYYSKVTFSDKGSPISF